MAFKTLLMSTPAFSEPVLHALLDLGHEVVVCTQPDKPVGRGMVTQPTPVKLLAQNMGIAVLQPASLRPAEEQRRLAALAPDLIVVAAYGKILPSPILALPRYGCINVHPSLLPKYRGPSPVVTTLLEGEQTTGVTLFVVDEGMDTGPIVAQRPVPIEPKDTAESLTVRLFREGASLLREMLHLWLEGRIKSVLQDNSKATTTRKIEKEDGRARWEMSAVELERRIRAFYPWPTLFTVWQEKMLKIMEGVIVDEASSEAPGTVVSLQRTDAPAGVVTDKGVLGIVRLQLEGKREMTCQEFLRGYRGFVGSKLPS